MASYYQILANFDPIFTAFEIWAKFCQKITKSPPKKFLWRNWPQIWGPLAHLLSKNWLIYYGKIFDFFFVKF